MRHRPSSSYASPAVIIAAAAAMVLTARVLADPQETQVFIGPFDVHAGSPNPANPSFAVTFTTAGYAPGFLRIVMNLEAVTPGTFSSDVTVTVTPPTGEVFDVAMGYPEPFEQLPDVTQSIPLPAGVEPAGVWTVRLYDSSQQGDGSGPEAAAANIRISLESVEPPVGIEAGILGPGVGGNTSPVQFSQLGLGSGAIQWFSFTTPALNTLASPRYLDIFTTGGNVDSVLALYDATGRVRAIDDDSGTGRNGFLSLGYGGGPTVGGGGPGDTQTISDGRGGKLAAGTYYLAVGEYGGGQPSFRPGWSVLPPPEGAGFNYGITFDFGTTAPVGSPPAAIDLGAFGSGTHRVEHTVESPATVSGAQATWWRVHLVGSAAGGNGFVDLTTSTPPGGEEGGTGMPDPEMGIYSAAGILAALDDDDGAGFNPFISLGAGGGTTTGEGPIGTPTVSDGRDGNLPEGDYYIAVADYNATFATGFTVSTTGGGGDVTLILRTNLPGEGDPCSPADLGSTGGIPVPDNTLNNNDFVVYIDYFFNHDARADLGSTGGVPGADGEWNNNDFVVYIDSFFNDAAACTG